MTNDFDELTDEEWQSYCWWREWYWLWGQIGLAEEQWATLYLPFMRR